jgi:ATP-dependent protease HslVU (ClpYQ) peptidase subunit
MMTGPIIFHGSTAECSALLAALERNCECKEGVRCSAHQLLDSQRALDGLLCERKRRLTLIEQEHRPG